MANNIAPKTLCIIIAPSLGSESFIFQPISKYHAALGAKRLNKPIITKKKVILSPPIVFSKSHR